jgi:uncharacterized membrane protein
MARAPRVTARRNLKAAAFLANVSAFRQGATAPTQPSFRRSVNPMIAKAHFRPLTASPLTGASAALLIALFPANPARADLKLCNGSQSRVGVSIGYQDAQGWATEGWWNIASQSCETLLKGAVPSRFIYVHAVDYDRGGEWAGTNFMCTADKSFAIRGVQDCSPRGYKRTGFFEVDTGEAQEWTVRLTDPDEKGTDEK